MGLFEVPGGSRGCAGLQGMGSEFVWIFSADNLMKKMVVKGSGGWSDRTGAVIGGESGLKAEARRLLILPSRPIVRTERSSGIARCSLRVGGRIALG